jgi:hypothetical protein
VVVKIDENEPNIFPVVDTTDVNVRDGSQEIDVILITRIGGVPVRIKVRLDRTKAQLLSRQLKAVLQG